VQHFQSSSIRFEIRARLPLADGRGNWKAVRSGYFKSVNAMPRIARSRDAGGRLNNWPDWVRPGSTRLSLALNRRLAHSRAQAETTMVDDVARQILMRPANE
jgi:hypothetical protein